MDKDRLSQALLALSEMMERLRGPDGCPWDVIQTDSTVKLYLLEEAYEVLDAIERGAPEDVCQELGDLLFQIIFLCKMAEERGEFDLVKVTEEVREKMVNRHPHVFGPNNVKSAEEVADNWARIKEREKEADKISLSLLKGVPQNLPALLRAHRLTERATRMDFDSPDAEEIWAEIEEGFGELRKNISEQDKNRIGKEMGDLLFALANLARVSGLNAEDLLREANRRFLERLKKIEEEPDSSRLESGRAGAHEIGRAREKMRIKKG